MAICYKCFEEFDDSQSGVCPHCGNYNNSVKKELYFLDKGTVLENRYIIGNDIGSGGFGITYAAWDTVLNKKVAIKEYFPSEFSTRMIGSTQVCAYDGEKSLQYEAGLKSFIEEALRLVKLNQLGNIVHVFDCFIANNTAYIIMEYAEGLTLSEMIKQKNAPLPYQEAVKIIIPVLNALDKVHQEGIVHRDIAPDNIKVDDQGYVTLLDFGAARMATVHYSKSMSVIVKPGFAPEEQYRSHGKQGAWTDVYAVAATLYYLITGKIPVPSIDRMENDTLETPSQRGIAIPESLENALMNALNVRAEYRTDNARQFADELSGIIEAERIIPPKSDNDDGGLTKKAKLIISLSVVTAIIAIIVIVITATNISNTFRANGNEVPNLTDMSVSEVDSALRKIGLPKDSYKVIGLVSDVPGAPETVVWQDIQGGTKLTADDEGIIINIKLTEPEIVNGEVPYLKALTKKEAKAALDEAGFNNYSFKRKKDNSVKAGLVCEQSVKGGKKVDVNKKIVVYIAENDSPVTEAETKTKTNITVTKTKTATKKDSNEKNSKNSSTGKNGNTKKKPPKTKATTTTTAPQGVEVPNVVGRSFSDANAILRDSGLYANQHDFKPNGKVVSQSPSAGSRVSEGSAVDIYF